MSAANGLALEASGPNMESNSSSSTFNIENSAGFSGVPPPPPPLGGTFTPGEGEMVLGERVRGRDFEGELVSRERVGFAGTPPDEGVPLPPPRETPLFVVLVGDGTRRR
jgi:hypothetical protein